MTTVIRKQNGEINRKKTTKAAAIDALEAMEAGAQVPSAPDTTPTPSVKRVDDFKNNAMVQVKNGKYSKKVSLALFNLIRSFSEDVVATLQDSTEDRVESGEA